MPALHLTAHILHTLHCITSHCFTSPYQMSHLTTPHSTPPHPTLPHPTSPHSTPPHTLYHLTPLHPTSLTATTQCSRRPRLSRPATQVGIFFFTILSFTHTINTLPTHHQHTTNIPPTHHQHTNKNNNTHSTTRRVQVAAAEGFQARALGGGDRRPHQVHSGKGVTLQ